MTRIPIPPHFDPERVGTLWKVPYEERAREAQEWVDAYHIPPAGDDLFRVFLLLVDVQNTFCLPDFELFVAGRSGKAAVEDCRRICEFIYRNLHRITRITPTMDTHQAIQIFHSVALVDETGAHPSPYTLITEESVAAGKWRLKPGLYRSLGMDEDHGSRFLLHYARKLREGGKYSLTTWPYHALLGGLGHALVPSVEEAIFFHTIARLTNPDFQVKGDNPLTEHYSVLGPEVQECLEGRPLGSRNQALVEGMLRFDAVVVAGEAKSHCVAWTIDDLLTDITRRDPRLAEKVYLLEDCTSPVVVPGVIDYTDDADEAFRRFSAAGMHVVRSTDPLETWPGMKRVSSEQ